MAKRDNIYEHAMGILERFVALEKELEEGLDQNFVSQLKDSMQYFAASKLRMDSTETSYSQAMDKIQSATTLEEANLVLDEFNQDVKGLSKIDGSSDKRFLQFVELVDDWEGDEDIRTVKSTRSVIDPISKQRMVDPVKNKKCGHSYERAVVLQLIAKNPKTRCPMMGCSALAYIKKSDLETDEDLKRYLAMNLDEHNKSLRNSNIVSLDETV